jgi:membrane associated rhomboid family serine protease
VMGRRYGVGMRAVLVTVGINLAIGFTIPGIDWRAHVGGLIGGAAITRLLIHK